jgi:hypothetical protein
MMDTHPHLPNYNQKEEKQKGEKQKMQKKKKK